MIRNCIRQIIEPLGFVHEGDNRWCAEVICPHTGNFLTVVADDTQTDEKGVPQILFSLCADNGETVNTLTLDQVLMAFDSGDLQKVPIKSHKIYVPVYNVCVQIPVDMGKVPQQIYDDLIRDGCMTERDIAERCAVNKLRDCFAQSPFNLIHFECENIIT